MTASGTGAVKTITVGAGVSTLAGLSDTTIASSAAGQTLLYDASDSYDNKQIKVFENNSAYTTAFPMFFGAQMFTVSAADTTNGYTFENYNSDGTDANNIWKQKQEFNLKQQTPIDDPKLPTSENPNHN